MSAGADPPPTAPPPVWLRPERIHHVGVAVPDLEEGMAQLGRALGLVWAPSSEWDVEGDGPDGVVRARIRIAWSTAGPVYTELLEGPTGSVWSTERNQELHHVCYGVDDVAAGSRQLEERGLPVEVLGSGGSGGSAAFAYHRSPDGMRVELLAGSQCEAIERWLAKLAAAAPRSEVDGDGAS